MSTRSSPTSLTSATAPSPGPLPQGEREHETGRPRRGQPQKTDAGQPQKSWACIFHYPAALRTSMFCGMSTPSPSSPQHHPTQLPAVLGLVAAFAIVVGEVIGSGIFLKPNQIAQATGGYVGLILSLWVVCGLISLCGALTLAELSAMLPHAGGTYIFLRDAYGKIWGFLWCWAEFWVIRSGAIAALATAVGLSIVNLIHN